MLARIVGLLLGTLTVLTMSGSAWADEVGWKVWQALRVEPGNVLFSPLSLEQALGVVALGARGKVARDLLAIPELRTQVKELADLSKEMAGVGEQLALANGVWFQTGHPLVQAFEHAVTTVGAVAATLDFRQQTEAARDTINLFVALHTAGHIRELLAAHGLPPSTDVFIVNALYFKGTWKHGFDTKTTQDGAFTTQAGAKVQVPLMHLEGTQLSYVEEDLAQLVALPYRDGRLQMLVILPRTPQDLSKLEESLSPKQLGTWEQGMRSTELQDVVLPRFQMHWSRNLIPALQASGFESLFQPDADFSGMSSRPEKVSQVLQAATITVNETGTEATAATDIGFRSKVIMIKPSFIADHAFIFCIRDPRTDTILFIGRVADPARQSNGGS